MRAESTGYGRRPHGLTAQRWQVVARWRAELRGASKRRWSNTYNDGSYEGERSGAPTVSRSCSNREKVQQKKLERSVNRAVQGRWEGVVGDGPILKESPRHSDTTTLRHLQIGLVQTLAARVYAVVGVGTRERGGGRQGGGHGRGAWLESALSSLWR